MTAVAIRAGFAASCAHTAARFYARVSGAQPARLSGTLAAYPWAGLAAPRFVFVLPMRGAWMRESKHSKPRVPFANVPTRVAQQPMLLRVIAYGERVRHVVEHGIGSRGSERRAVQALAVVPRSSMQSSTSNGAAVPAMSLRCAHPVASTRAKPAIRERKLTVSARAAVREMRALRRPRARSPWADPAARANAASVHPRARATVLHTLHMRPSVVVPSRAASANATTRSTASRQTMASRGAARSARHDESSAQRIGSRRADAAVRSRDARASRWSGHAPQSTVLRFVQALQTAVTRAPSNMIVMSSQRASVRDAETRNAIARPAREQRTVAIAAARRASPRAAASAAATRLHIAERADIAHEKARYAFRHAAASRTQALHAESRSAIAHEKARHALGHATAPHAHALHAGQPGQLRAPLPLCDAAPATVAVPHTTSTPPVAHFMHAHAPFIYRKQPATASSGGTQTAATAARASASAGHGATREGPSAWPESMPSGRALEQLRRTLDPLVRESVLSSPLLSALSTNVAAALERHASVERYRKGEY